MIPLAYVFPLGAFVLSYVQFAQATEYLLLIMATNEQGFVKEVGECSADRGNFGRVITGDEAIAAYQAQRANFQGLIVYNTEGANYPVEMGSDGDYGPQVVIPAFMVGYDCGWAIIRTFTYEKGFGFLIRVYWSYHDLLRYLVPFVVVVGICFFVMLAAMLVKCVGDRRRDMRRRLAKRHLKQIPTKKFVKGEDPETCPICLDDFEEDEKLRILPCGHAYHCRCIDPWLLKMRRVCPICKRKVLPGTDDSSDSEADERNAGPSGVTASTERTPLLTTPDRDRITAGNSTFYGVYDRPRLADCDTTPPLDRGRPILLSPASTPGDGPEETGAAGGSTEHLMDCEAPPGRVNPNYVHDPDPINSSHSVKTMP